MSRAFNLIDEKWIPVRLLDGSRDELGIRATLLRAKDIAAIEDPSPLVVASLHRFLLALLYRALEGPTDIEQAKILFKTGLPTGKIEAYLEKWRDRFWLFDDKYPFGQVPSFEPKAWRAWTVLAAEHNADHATVLFDHIDVEHPDTITAAATVRWILAAQTFSVSCGKSELSHTSTAPSATSVMVIPQGKSLNDTLVLSLVPENRAIISKDLALWERMPEDISYFTNNPERIVSGFADLYTWRTRSIHIEESMQIAKLAFASGVKFVSTGQIDPMLAYRIDERIGKLPMQFNNRGLWRDFDSLLPDQSGLAPLILDHAISLARIDPKRFPRSIIVLGQAHDKAKIEFWRMERFIMPQALLGDCSIRSSIKSLLGIAKDTQKALWGATKTYARNVLSRGNRDPAGKDISAFIDQLPCNSLYWSNLEPKFHDVLKAYTLDKDPNKIEFDWLVSVRSTLMDAWDQHRASVSTSDAWSIRALVKSEVPISRKIKDLDNQIAEFKTSLQKEGA
jgi:CRISPR system Cascade subunit CasA